MKKDTSWGNVAGWYDELLAGEGTYQKEVILPNLVRLLGDIKGKRVLDLACGQGFFTREWKALGAEVTGADISPELIHIARENNKGIPFFYCPADAMPSIPSGTRDIVTIVLALQNIENLDGTLAEVNRILAPKGKFYIVLNHPTFRIPGASSWGWTEDNDQYRRVDPYLSEQKNEIEMHPGKNRTEKTVSFHRPLQLYFKKFERHGFAVTRLEEWNSHKKSAPGPRAAAENHARKEIPLFMCLVLQKQ